MKRLNSNIPDISPLWIYRYDISNKLSKSTLFKVTFITSPVGYGKTVSVCMWADRLNKKNNIKYYLPGDQLPDYNYDEQKFYVIFDNLQLFSEQELIYIISYIENSPGNYSFILLSTRELPNGLKAYMAENVVSVINADDLAFKISDCINLLELANISLEENEVFNIISATKGHVTAINIFVNSIKLHSNTWNKTVYMYALKDYFSYFDLKLWKEWDEEKRLILCKFSLFESLSLSLICMFMQINDEDKAIEELDCFGNLILKTFNGDFCLNPILKQYIDKKTNEMLTKAEIKDIYIHAALYYLSIDDTINALRLFFSCRRLSFCYSFANHSGGAARRGSSVL